MYNFSVVSVVDRWIRQTDKERERRGSVTESR